MKIKLMLFLFLFVNSVYGGFEKGNGGDALVCRNDNNEIIRAELLDFYEAREFRLIPFEDHDSFTLEESFNFLLKHLHSSMPNLTRDLRTIGYDIIQGKSSLFKKGIKLENIDDSLHIFVDEGCSIEQVAVHREPLLVSDKRFIINADIWYQMNSFHKAGLILHEAIYYLVQKNGVTDSRWVRYFVSLISTADKNLRNQELKNPTNQFKLMQNLTLGFFEIPGAKIDFSKNNNDQVILQKTPNSSQLETEYFSLALSSSINKQKIRSLNLDDVKGYGIFQRLYITSDVLIINPSTHYQILIESLAGTFDLKPNRFNLNNNASLSENSYVNLDSEGKIKDVFLAIYDVQDYYLKRDILISFHDKEYLVSCISKDGWIKFTPDFMYGHKILVGDGCLLKSDSGIQAESELIIPIE